MSDLCYSKTKRLANKQNEEVLLTFYVTNPITQHTSTYLQANYNEQSINILEYIYLLRFNLFMNTSFSKKPFPLIIIYNYHLYFIKIFLKYIILQTFLFLVNITLKM